MLKGREKEPEEGERERGRTRERACVGAAHDGRALDARRKRNLSELCEEVLMTSAYFRARRRSTASSVANADLHHGRSLNYALRP